MTPKRILTIIGIFVGLFLFMTLKPFVAIDSGHRGVISKFGAIQDIVLPEGLQWRTPIVQSIYQIDVRTQKIQKNVISYSKDIQQVTAGIALNFRLEATKVNKLIQEVGLDYENRIIDPSIQESVKSALAKFTAQELIEQRPKVKDEIKNELLKRLNDRYIIVEDFSITDFSFSDQYEKAVEEKQVAQQLALKAENELKRIKIEAEQKIATAQAEAETIRIQAQAVTQQGGHDYVQLQAIKKWDGKLPAQMIPNAVVPFIDLTK